MESCLLGMVGGDDYNAAATKLIEIIDAEPG
jgi:hypothetical protein